MSQCICDPLASSVDGSVTTLTLTPTLCLSITALASLWDEITKTQMSIDFLADLISDSSLLKLQTHKIRNTNLASNKK